MKCRRSRSWPHYPVHELRDLAEADIVLEAAAEDLEIKKELFVSSLKFAQSSVFSHQHPPQCYGHCCGS